MKSIVQNHFPIILAVSILLVTVAILLFLSLEKTGGRIVYAIDDPYIHMAIAKNIVKHGVWGVTRYEFSSSSSSILWVLLLAGVYSVSGVNEVSPLVLNVIFAIGTLFCVYLILRKFKIALPYILLILLGVLFYTPMPALIFTGMEHILYLLLVLLFVYNATQLLSSETHSSHRHNFYILLGLAPALTLVRYEGLFLIFVVSVILILHKQWLRAIVVGLCGVVPLVIYGFISASQGWYWLPNSVLLKGRRIYLTTWQDVFPLLDFRHFISVVYSAPEMLLLFDSALVLFILQFGKKWAISKQSRLLISIFLFTLILHIQFADIGWFYRYESYLVALGIFVIFVAGYEYLHPERQIENPHLKIRHPKYITGLLLFILFNLLFIQRARTSTVSVPDAVNNIYEQHYQIGLFLKKFYRGETVALNDIGAPNYLADIRCIDLWGLGTKEVAQMKRNGTYNRKKLQEMVNSRGVKIAIVYDRWFESGQIITDGVPSDWKLVGQWTVSYRIVSNHSTVSFYAINSAEEKNLIAHFKEFLWELPRNGMTVTDYSEGKYIIYRLIPGKKPVPLNINDIYPESSG